MPIETFNSSTTWTCPADVTSVVAECWGGGGGGQFGSPGAAGSGGGGGAYARKTVTVVPGNNYTVSVGAGGLNNNAGGGDTFFSTSGTVMAKGGTRSNPGVGGQASASVGDIKFNGGNGGSPSGAVGGGGGGAGGSTEAGDAGTSPTAGAGGDVGGGAGGDAVANQNGTVGTAPGGGGGGGSSAIRVGASGAAGRVVLTYSFNIPDADDAKIDVFYAEIFGDTPPTLDALGTEVFGDVSPKVEMAYIEIFGDTNTLTEPSGDGGDPEGNVVSSVGVGRIASFGVEVLIKRNAPPVTTTNNCSLYIYGVEQINDNTTLFVSGEPHRGDIPLYIGPIAYNSGGPPLFVEGAEVWQTGIPLYMYGHQPVNSGIPLYTISSLPYSGEMPLYIAGHIPSNSSIPLYVQGSIAINSGIPLYLYNRPETSHIALYIGDLGNRIEDGMPLYLYNQAAVSGMELVVWGDGTNIGWKTANGQLNLFINADGAPKEIPLYINAPTGEYNNNMPLYLQGLQLPPTGLPLFIGTQYDLAVDNLRLYTHGF